MISPTLLLKEQGSSPSRVDSSAGWQTQARYCVFAFKPLASYSGFGLRRSGFLRCDRSALVFCIISALRFRVDLFAFCPRIPICRCVFGPACRCLVFDIRGCVFGVGPTLAFCLRGPIIRRARGPSGRRLPRAPMVLLSRFRAELSMFCLRAPTLCFAFG